MPQEPRRSVVPIAVLGVLAVVAVLWWGAREREPSGTAARPADESAQRVEAGDGGAPGPDAPAAPPAATDGGGPARPPEPPETPWAAVDLERIREAMPDNLYWKMSAPTKDEALIRERREERERWNVQYGKVLSNTASAEEIDAYYAHQHRLSSDYVEFATFLLAEYGDELGTQDVGLLKVAIELNLARLEEIPRHAADAHERRKAHDAARRAWLEQQKAFEEKISR